MKSILYLYCQNPNNRIMHTKFLLPHRAKIWGWVIAIPALAIMVMYLNFDYEFPFLDYTGKKDPHLFDKGWLFNIEFNNFTDEIGGILLIIGLLLIALSKEKDEDERIRQLRLESLLWATLVNSIMMAVAIILFYNDLFLKVMAYNVCSTLILFIIRFNLIVYLERKQNDTGAK